MYELPSTVTEAASAEGLLSEQLQRIVLPGSSRQDRILHVGGGSMMMSAEPTQLLHVPLGSSFSFTTPASGNIGSIQQDAVEAPNQAVNVELGDGAEVVPSDLNSQTETPQYHSNLYVVPAGVVAGSSHSAFSQPVEDSGGNPLLKKMNEALLDQGISLQHRSSWNPPAGADFLRAPGKFTGYDVLQALSLEYNGESLTNLADLLKRGKIIIRVHQSDGSVILLHIHADHNQAVLITDNGNTSCAVDPESLSMLLTNVFASEAGTQIEVFLYTEPVAQASQQVIPVSQNNEEWEIVPEYPFSCNTPASTTVSASAAPVAGLSDSIIGFIHEQLRPIHIPGVPQQTQAMSELLAYGDNDVAVIPVMSIYNFVSSGTGANEVYELITLHASLLIFVQNSNQSLVISVEHTKSGNVAIAFGNQQLEINSKDFMQLMDWLSFHFQIVRLFYQMLFV